MWREVGGKDYFIGFTGQSWMVQPEKSLGSRSGFLSVADEAATPDLCVTRWSVPTDGDWQPDPGLRCVEADAVELPPPVALRLSAEGAEGVDTPSLGLYKHVAGKEVHGAPC